MYPNFRVVVFVQCHSHFSFSLLLEISIALFSTALTFCFFFLLLFFGVCCLGLGMVTPLGCGVETTWRRLIKGESGIRAITLEDLKMDTFDGETQLHTFDQLTSKVAAFVPCGNNPGEFNEDMWLKPKVSYWTVRFSVISLRSC